MSSVSRGFMAPLSQVSIGELGMVPLVTMTGCLRQSGNLGVFWKNYIVLQISCLVFDPTASQERLG